MGIAFHKTLIITGGNYKSNLVDNGGKGNMEIIHEKATSIFSKYDLQHLITDMHGGMNSIMSFCVLPSGSNEGWGMSDEFNLCLEELCDYMDELRVDGDNWPCYSLLTHGGDSKGCLGEAGYIDKDQIGLKIDRSELDCDEGLRMIAMDCETGGIGDEVSLLTVWFGIYNNSYQLLDELSLKIKPKDGIYHIQAEALTINKIDIIEHDKVAITKSEAGKLLYKFLEKNKFDEMIIPVGHNVAGDVRWVNQHLLNADTWNQFCSYRKLDSSTIAQFLMLNDKLTGVKKASLSVLIDRFNLKDKIEGQAHEEKFDAIASIMAIKEMGKIVKDGYEE